MDNRPFTKFNTATLILIVLVGIIMAVSYHISQSGFDNDAAQTQRDAVNKTTIVNNANTQKILHSQNLVGNLTIKAIRLLENNTDFLVDNFGPESGYLENEALHNRINNETNMLIHELLNISIQASK